MKPARTARRSEAPARNGDLAAIHIAKAKLGLDDDAYRDLMATVCHGVRSAGDLDFTGRRRFLAHLQACLRQQQPDTARKGDVVRSSLSAHQRLMWSLWMRLADAGLVTERSMAALNAFARRQTGVDRIDWLTTQQDDLVIASLKAWLKRGGPEAP